MNNSHDQYYTNLRERLLTDEQKILWQEAENNPEGSKTLIIRTDPSRMSQKRNQVKRKYDHRRNWRK